MRRLDGISLFPGILSLLLLLAGCAGAPFSPPELVAVRPQMTVEELAGGAWTAQDGVYRLRQTVLFEFRGARVPMSGLMRLDFDGHKARLVAMNDLGVKFFDLAVDEKGEEQKYLLPDLARIPRFSEAVATSVRRVFLSPCPGNGDALRLARNRYFLVRPSGDGEIRFTFGGNDPQLLETKVETEREKWEVRYFEYRKAGETVFPRGIVLEDRLAGYRLTLWLEEVERIDEQDEKSD